MMSEQRTEDADDRLNRPPEMVDRRTQRLRRRAQRLSLKVGSEPFRVAGQATDVTLLDYWRWCGSDLLSNTQRGVMAEFLVARALGTADTARLEWGAFDVRTRHGHGVEVKSAAYWQSWPQAKPSVIEFDIAPRKRVWDPLTNESETHDPPRRTAQVYVFCLFGDLTGSNPDPLDVDQWQFLVLATSKLDSERPAQKKIRLNPLLTLQPRDVSYAGLRRAIETAVRAGR